MGSGTVDFDLQSHFTILQPRETSTADSIRIATDYFEVLLQTDKDRRINRKEFFVAILLFCLNLGNLWRFPKLMLLNGKATFVYLYIFFVIVNGTSILYFEVALGQYATGGFSRVFGMSPLFQGITFSMGIYCIVINMVYNYWNIFHFHYLIAALSSQLPFSSKFYNATNSSDEAIFFQRSVVRSQIEGEDTWLNFVNFSLLLLIWGVIVIVYIRGTFNNYKILVTLCCLMTLSIFFTLIVAGVSFPRGALQGLQLMFIPDSMEFKDTTTWGFAFEQSVVSLGLGMGPMIALGSYSKFRSPAQIDCFLINVISLVISLAFCLLVCIILGQLAEEMDLHVFDYIEFQLADYQSLHIHVIISQLMDRLQNGLSQFIMALFYFSFLCVGIYCALELTKITEMLISSTILLRRKHKTNSILLACFISFLIGLTLIPNEHLYISIALDKGFLGLPLLIIVMSELVAIGYIYSIYSFCDDIEFMFGTIPHIWFQISWLVLPLVFFAFIVIDVAARITTTADLASMVCSYLILALTVLPIVITGVVKFCTAVKVGNVASILGPRDMVPSSPLSEMTSDSLTKYFNDLEKNLKYSYHGVGGYRFREGGTLGASDSFIFDTLPGRSNIS